MSNMGFFVCRLLFSQNPEHLPNWQVTLRTLEDYHGNQLSKRPITESSPGSAHFVFGSCRINFCEAIPGAIMFRRDICHVVSAVEPQNGKQGD